MPPISHLLSSQDIFEIIHKNRLSFLKILKVAILGYSSVYFSISGWHDKSRISQFEQ